MSCHTRRLRLVDIGQMDPSMLVGFLIRDMNDWQCWKKAIQSTSKNAKAIIHVSDQNPAAQETQNEREGAYDEVESLDGVADDEENLSTSE
jgi:cysteine protease ATG4